MYFCCCCLRGSSDKDLTTPYIHLGKTEIYSDMLKQCFDLQLTLGSSVPRGICLMCVSRLRDASDFKLQVQHSQAELQALLEGVKNVKEELSDEYDMDSGECGGEEIVLKESPVEFDTESGECGGEEIVLKEPPVEFDTESGECGGEEIVLNSEPAVKTGESDEESEEDPISLAFDAFDGAVGVGTELELYLSAYDRRRLALASSVRLERLRSDEAPHENQTCTVTSHHEPRQASRMENIHTPNADDQTDTCDIYEKQFTAKSNLISIYEQEHLPHTLWPEACSKKAYFKTTQKHSDKKTYCCDVCKKQFRSKLILIRHISKYTNVDHYDCRVCNKTFLNRLKFKKHLKSHAVDRPYECEECNRHFFHKGNLNIHKRTHTGDKPFICKTCDKRFVQKSQLDQHERIHTGVKPYSCKSCNKRFVQKSHLNQHERVHSGVKPFKCKECNMLFAQKSNLDQHERTHSGIKPYECKECYMRYTQKHSLEKHVKNLHGNV